MRNYEFQPVFFGSRILESGAGRGDLAVSANNHFESNVMKVGKGRALNTMMTLIKSVLENTTIHQNHLKITPYF
jgi:hypothetical protein